MPPEKILNISKVSTGRLICVPEDVATELGGLEPGDKVLWIRKDGEIIVRKT